MRNITLIGLVAAFASSASAACSSALKIDDFSKWSSNTNSLNSWTSDDGSMSSISAASGVLSFKPKADSYFYETFACQAASTNGYNSLQFSIKGPSGGSATVELQTQTSCSATSYKSYFTQVSGLTGATQTITIPFTQFTGANANAITAVVFSGFSSTTATWQLSNLQFGCGGTASSSTTKPATSTPSPTPSPTKAATSSTLITLTSSAVPSGTCSPLLVDDWTSQSRLTFLFYNAMGKPTSDDGTMTSLVVGTPAKNRVTINPKNTASYFYTQVTCTNAQNKYGGLSLRIKAPAGTTFSVELDSSSSCSPEAAQAFTQTTSQLGWTFDGTEKLYSIPFSKFSGLDTSKLTTILFTQFTKSVSFGPLAFYCGNTASEYVVTTTAVSAGPSSTVAAPSGTAAALVVDKFANANTNALGFWHGGDEGMTTTYSGGKLTIKSTDADYSFYTQVSGSCSDFTKYKGSYLHIAYSGSTDFTVAVQQHNSKCDETIAPYPETWDSAEASRYAKNGHIYIPMNHFNVDLTRTIGIAIKGFFSANTVTLSVIEIVPSVPAGTTIPNKLETGDLVFACKRPNSFAFAIDDGSPEYAQEVMKIVKEEGIKVTFFTVGAPLLDASTNLTNVYKEMMSQGHQIALHSYTHPKMEGLPDYASIDWEYNEDIKAVKQQLNGLASNYFRPPFGNEGARMRSRLAQSLGAKPTITMWSVDVEDWLWAETDTPEQQLKAFQRDVDKGGNLVVLHYLYPSTVSYLRQFIQIAKKTGKQLMRVDQCMQDPNAPAV
ncbi:carbohydrate esterase family 4 protein [Lentithecium fluviatile CBS 122367]|uniref:Carbohydrate esterase family 4 protein n=1 Tax=Lentithecium fluviatile CBS 122367 TaxID=1168545 RepID=A0A6G1J859_9PLEO|nr:carbohydrate esterase family 4 protein [Lentithecium fluviatile CBS 122367]